MFIKNKKSINTTTSMLLMLLIATPALSETKGKPFTLINNQIDQLQDQINNIQLTPGPVGAQGLKGDTGLTGAIGAQGLKGDTGLAGAIGAQGSKGDTGLAGATGAQGSKGDTGLTGAIGVQGDTGLTGSIGTAGINGTSCSVAQGAGSATISCEDGTMASVYDQTGETSSRKTSYVSGFNQTHQTRAGFVPHRELTFTKLKDNTDLKINYTDNFGLNGASTTREACNWEVMIDGVSCPTGQLKYAFFDTTRSNTSYSSQPFKTSSVAGYCQSIPAGVHTISVYASAHEFWPTTNCYTGHQTSWTLEVEELN